VSDDRSGWQKALHSIANGACVEVRADGGEILLRNSRDHGVVLRFTREEIAAFFHGIRNGEFDNLIG
jgi:uncharacterized protein DUF397